LFSTLPAIFEENFTEICEETLRLLLNLIENGERYRIEICTKVFQIFRRPIECELLNANRIRKNALTVVKLLCRGPLSDIE
jgi:hypothetical protein